MGYRPLCNCIFVNALALLNNLLNDNERNEREEMGDGGFCHSNNIRHAVMLPNFRPGAAVWDKVR